LNAQVELFADPERAQEQGPHVVVIDGFYDDPDAVRKVALECRFVQYHPPDVAQVGASIARQYTGIPGQWVSSALLAYVGRPVAHPWQGFRHNPPELRGRLSRLLGEDIDAETWDTLGDGWNGAFHLISADWSGPRDGSVHHHFKAGDVCPRGWSGVVYLSPDAPPWSGTSVWRHRATGRCVAPYGALFERDSNVRDNFDLALLVENRYNRLVLLRESVLHRAETGFGAGRAARLTQTLFFKSEPIT
jgi:hypothetical protein